VGRVNGPSKKISVAKVKAAIAKLQLHGLSDGAITEMLKAWGRSGVGG